MVRSQRQIFCNHRTVITSTKEVMFLPDFVCLFVCLSVCLCVCQQDNSKSYGRIFLKFSGNVGNGKNYQRFNFGVDPEGILDSGSLKFSLTSLSMGHKGNRCQTEHGAAIWRTTWLWRRSAGSDCFLVLSMLLLERSRRRTCDRDARSLVRLPVGSLSSGY